MNLSPTSPRPLLRCLPLLALVVLSFSAFRCSFDSHNFGVGMTGTGPVKSESRPLAPFTAIEVSGSVDTEWAPGDAFSAVVEAQENLLPHLKTEIVDGTLKVYCDKSYSTTAPLKIKLTGKPLDRVSLSGSGDFTATELTSAQLKVILSGSGDMTLAGEAQDLSLVLSGSGTIEAKDLKAHTADAIVTGSGDISVHATDELTATVTGSGSITYTGHPKKVTKEITGSGEVEEK